MNEKAFEKAKRAARRARDQKIKQALRTDGKRPRRSERKLPINAEFVTIDDGMSIRKTA